MYRELARKGIWVGFPFPLFFSFFSFFFCFWCLVGTTLFFSFLFFFFLFLFWRGRYFLVAQLKSHGYPTDSSLMNEPRCTTHYTHAKPSNRGWTSLTRSKGIRKGSIKAYKAQSRGWNVANSGKLLVCFTSGGPTGVAGGPTGGIGPGGPTGWASGPTGWSGLGGPTGQLAVRPISRAEPSSSRPKWWNSSIPVDSSDQNAQKSQGE